MYSSSLAVFFSDNSTLVLSSPRSSLFSGGPYLKIDAERWERLGACYRTARGSAMLRTMPASLGDFHRKIEQQLGDCSKI